MARELPAAIAHGVQELQKGMIVRESRWQGLAGYSRAAQDSTSFGVDYENSIQVVETEEPHRCAARRPGRGFPDHGPPPQIATADQRVWGDSGGLL